MRKEIFANEEFYHVYNRGVEKRDIFQDEQDFQRFLQSMQEFNVPDPIGSIYEHSFIKSKLGSRASKSERESLVDIVAYCLNPNHFHFLLRQRSEKGIEKFMHRLGTGYTKYFNHRYKRSGSLFQGKFKAIHVHSNEHLLHLSVYINLNYKVHRLGSSTSKSSWLEYVGVRKSTFVEKEIILGCFGNRKEYETFAQETQRAILERRILAEEPF